MEEHKGLMESIFSGWKFVPLRLLEQKTADRNEGEIRTQHETHSSETRRRS
jgi:hypothetical protein